MPIKESLNAVTILTCLGVPGVILVSTNIFELVVWLLGLFISTWIGLRCSRNTILKPIPVITALINSENACQKLKLQLRPALVGGVVGAVVVVLIGFVFFYTYLTNIN